MTVTICWSVKGGSGTTVTVAATALAARSAVTLVDLDGDLPAVLGVPESEGQGLVDWFATDVPAAALGDLAVPIGDRVRLIPRGHGPGPSADDDRWASFGDWLRASRSDVLVDAGTGHPPAGLVGAVPDARRWLVTRPCYLSLRRAAASPVRPDGVVLVAEPGRALRPHDVATAVGAPIVASVSLDPAIARAVDAGLLVARLPKSALTELARAA